MSAAILISAITQAAVEGAITAACNNADKLGALGKGLAAAAIDAYHESTQTTARNADAPPEQSAVEAAAAAMPR